MKKSKILFDKDVCQNFNLAIEKEWLETNGIGGFASSTIIGANTRRYHGLLVANIGPHITRLVMLSKFEERIILPQGEIDFSTNLYPNSIFPNGFAYQESFELSPFPKFTYKFGNITLEKTCFMVHNENTTVIIYSLIDGADSVGLKIRPLLAFRDYHNLTRANDYFNPMVLVKKNLLKFKPYRDLSPMFFLHNAEGLDESYFWYYNFEYIGEQKRGLDFREDLCSPCELTFRINKVGTEQCSVPTKAFVIASDTRETVPDTIQGGQTIYVCPLYLNEFERRNNLIPIQGIKKGKDEIGVVVRDLSRSLCDINVAPRNDTYNVTETLFHAADSFIITTKDGFRSIIAGYHWFTDWGRDSMISLPGLTLITSRFDDAREILLTFAKFCDRGIIPNRFPDYSSQPDYNTADASLWFINAIYQYFIQTNDIKTLKESFYPVLCDIIENYKKGTKYNIHLDSDNLIYQGEAGVQLTWMDAKIGDWVITPRKGKNVEINALWYNGLKAMAFFAEKIGGNDDTQKFESMSLETKKSFNDIFWNDKLGCLYDTVDGFFNDDSIRPNQIFAISLPFTMLSTKKEKSVLEIVEKHLLTPYGLRSLSPEHKNYIGQYTGNQTSRDIAYHQGTVWSWLIGPYVDAYLKIYGDDKQIKEELLKRLEPLIRHIFEDGGIGSISELFDGDAPHQPGGCISQAWSVAELLRVYQRLTKM